MVSVKDVNTQETCSSVGRQLLVPESPPTGLCATMCGQEDVIGSVIRSDSG